jgi:hypothetical protein
VKIGITQAQFPHNEALAKVHQWSAVVATNSSILKQTNRVLTPVSCRATMICVVEVEMIDQLVERFPSLL